MSTPFGINGGIVKYDRLAMLAYFIADRGRNLKFAARGQSKLDFVEDLTGNPTVLCYTRNGGEPHVGKTAHVRSEEHTSELQSLMRISYAVFCLQKKTNRQKLDDTVSSYIRT